MTDEEIKLLATYVDCEEFTDEMAIAFARSVLRNQQAELDLVLEQNAWMRKRILDLEVGLRDRMADKLEGLPNRLFLATSCCINTTVQGVDNLPPL